jgi:hypothetical protein
MKYTEIGSISTGTLKREDLLPRFIKELEHQVERNRDLPSNQFLRHLDLLARAEEWANTQKTGDEDVDELSLDELTLEVMDALDEFAPPGAYFGAHPGDGADFGFWPSED